MKIQMAMKKSLICSLLVLAFAGATYAQLSIRKFSLGYSQWNRAYDGSDERVFFSSAYNPAVDFTQKSGMPTVSGELQLYKGLGLEGRLGLWKHTFENSFEFGDDQISERISQRIIPGTVNILYNAEITPRLNFYGGIGVTRYFLQEKVERKVTPGAGSIDPTTFTGNNYGWNNQLGIEYWFSGNFGVAIEGRQHYGKYDKSYIPVTDGAPVTTTIDLRGLEVGVSLRYRLTGKKKEKKDSGADSPELQKATDDASNKPQEDTGTVKQEPVSNLPEVVFETKPDAPSDGQQTPAQNQPAAEKSGPAKSTQSAGAASAEPCPPAGSILTSPGDPIPLNQAPISKDYPTPGADQIPSIFKAGITEFPLGSDDLGQTEVTMLDETAAFLKKYGQYNVILYGHACDIGTPERNYGISLKRADKARTLLINRGIDAGRIAIVGMGAQQPKVPNTSEENRRINRRIEVFKFIAR